MKTNQPHTDFVETKIRDGSDRLITASRSWLEVADAMSEDVVAISSDETVVSTAKIMADKNVSCIVVEANGTICGIVTETDLLKRTVVEAKDFQSTKISEIMSFPIESVSSHLSVLDASEIMDAKGIKRLPVLAEERLVGIVTQTDLIRVLTSYGMWRDVSMIMSRDALGIPKQATVTEATKVMAARNASSVVIMDDNEVVGIFTARDLFKRVIAQKSHPDRTRVGEVMSSPVVSITPDTSVFSASRIMEKMHVRKLVVMEDKQLYGVLSQTDIFMAVKRKLQEEEEKNNKLLELSKSNIYTLLLDGKITYVNPSFMDLLGISDPMELVGEDFLPERFWVNPEDGENFLRELQDEMVQAKELNLKDSKGRKVYVTFFSNFSKDAYGKTNGIQGVLQDITAKKELVALREAKSALQISKQQLKVSNEQLRATNQQLESEIFERKQAEEELLFKTTLLEAQSEESIDGILIIDDCGKVILSNKHFGNMWNIPPQLIDTKDDEKLLQYVLEQLKDSDEFLKKVKYLYVNKDEKSRDEIQLKDGKVFDRYSSPMTDSNGVYRGRIWYFRDITERKQAEKQLRQERNFSQSIIETAQTIMLVLDTDGNILSFNPYMEEMCGYGLGEVKGKNWFDTFLPQRDRQRIRELFNKAIDNIQTLGNVNPIVTKDGREVEIKWYDKTLKDINGNTIGLLAIGQDVTEQRQYEEKLKLAKIEAEAASQTKSQFLANMSHEIRTPMNAIIGFSDLLAGEDLTDEQKQEINIISESGHNLLALINDILDLSKIEAGQLDIEIIDYSLTKLLNSIGSLMRPKVIEKGLEFEVVESSSLPAQIRSDPTYLRQCLINLIGNAVKFTEQGHVYVNISLENKDDQAYIRFDVEDTGIGIPKDKQETIFESFTQADGDTTRKYGGTGLGLTITKQLAELLGGELTLTSEVGKGSVFSLTIPANVEVTKQPLLDRHNIAGHTDPSQAKAEQPEFSGNILVAEDAPSNRVLIKSLLKQLGLQVTIAKDGNEALQKVRAQQFDLIFMDIMMPHMDGYKATKAIRKAGITTPIVALTANAMKGDDKRCIEAGCDDYLAKPIDRRELLRIINKYLASEEKVLSGRIDSANWS